MRFILRSILAVVVGFIVASLLMMVVESLNTRVLYPELAAVTGGMKDKEAVGALLVVIVAWTLGSLAGGWVAAKISPSANALPSLVLGVMLTLAGIANNLMVPPPVWFWILSLLVLIPASYVGARYTMK